MVIRQLSRRPIRPTESLGPRGNVFGVPSELLLGYSTEIDRLCFQTSDKAVLIAAALLAWSPVVWAGQPFDAEAFQSAQTAEKAILVDVTASWCPTCRQQRPTIEQIEKEKRDLVVYEVDFDTAKDLLKRFRVQYQSTLIVFRGAKEVARSTGETDPALIRAMIAKAF